MLQSLTFDRVKELLIIIPAAHVFLCFTYLFFYDISFGYGVWLFASPTDVFSISFSEVAPGYIFLFVGMMIGNYIFSPVAKAAAEGVAGYKVPLYFKFVFWSGAIGGAFGIVLAAIVWFRSGFLLYELLSTPIALLAGYLWGGWGRKLTNNAVTLNVSLALIMALISTGIRGLGDGQLDRASRVSDIQAYKPTCGDKVILRALSSNFLAAATDNSRVIVNEDCSVKFILFPAKKFIARPDGAPVDIAFGS